MPAPNMTNVEIIVAGNVTTSSGSSRTVENVFHLKATLWVLAALETSVWAAFNTNIWSLIAAQLSVDFVGAYATVRNMDDSTYSPVLVGTPASGGAALPRADSALAAVLLLRTGMRGKSYRGAKHFGPLPLASVSKDELTGGAVTAFGAILTAMQTPFSLGGGSNTYVCSVFSRTTSQSLVNPTNLTNTQLSAFGRVNKTLGTMRRRKEKTNF